MNQLKKGGRLLVPLGPMDDFQKLTAVDRSPDNTLTKTELLDVAYDPIMRKALQVDIHRFQEDPVDEKLFTFLNYDSDELFSRKVWEVKQDPLYSTEPWVAQPPGFTTPGEILTPDKDGNVMTCNYSMMPEF